VRDGNAGIPEGEFKAAHPARDLSILTGVEGAIILYKIGDGSVPFSE
jgi:hypothetical protein